MITKVNEKIDVLMNCSSRPKKEPAMPQKIKWHGRVFTIQTIDMHHTVREGRQLCHIFSVSDGAHYFRLKFNTENLFWVLEEFSDGLAD